MRRALFASVVGVVAVGFVGSAAVFAPLATAASRSTPAAPHGVVAPNSAPSVALCAPARPGFATCFARRRTDLGVQSFAVNPAATPAGYGPTDLRSAYSLPSTGGNGRTVAIVDAYDDPHAESDLQTYRSQYGLPTCTTSNGCFRKINERGGTSYPTADAGWSGEIALDIDMVSAICPTCHILLVEADDPTIGNLGPAVNEAVKLGAVAVSNSYGGPESSSDPSDDSAYYNHPGVAITVSAGDNGYGVEFPASSPHVTAVGGTSLSRSSNSRGWSESVWSGSGSGCSAIEKKPSWQHDSGCSRRTVADVSADADPSTGVAVYNTYGDTGWQVYGGTSVASPVVGGIYALAGTPASSTYPSSYPYSHTSSLHDVTSGSNGSCGSYLCNGHSGYDGPTGLGTPNGLTAFRMTQTSPSGSYEAESSANTLTGSAKVSSCSACSGGKKVGYIGNGSTLVYRGVSVTTAGTYAVAVAYADGSASGRSATFSVNGGAATSVSFAPTGGFSTPGTQTVKLTLAAGSNAITIANPTAYAPDMDKITVPSSPVSSPSSKNYEAESTANTLAGGAKVSSCSACSGGAKVGYVGKGGTLQFNSISVSTAGTYNVVIQYCDGTAARSANVSTNGGTAKSVSFAVTGGFSTPGTVTVALSLRAGTNTVLISNSSAYAPDFDRITVPGSPS